MTVKIGKILLLIIKRRKAQKDPKTSRFFGWVILGFFGWVILGGFFEYQPWKVNMVGSEAYTGPPYKLQGQMTAAEGEIGTITDGCHNMIVR